MVIKKNVTLTPGVNSNCKNVCLITAGMETAVCRAHCENGGRSKFITTIFLHLSFLQIVLSTSYENGYCLPMLMAWENRKVNGVIACRMGKYNTYLCQSMLGLYPKAHFILGIGDLCPRHWWFDYSAMLVEYYILEGTNRQTGILDVGFPLLFKWEDGGGCSSNGFTCLCLSFPICKVMRRRAGAYHCCFFCCYFSIINKDLGHLNAPLLAAWF